MIANMTLAANHSKKRMVLSDFILKFDDERGEVPKGDEGRQSQAEVARLKMIAQMWTALSNAEEERKRK